MIRMQRDAAGKWTVDVGEGEMPVECTGQSDMVVLGVAAELCASPEDAATVARRLMA